MKKVMVYEQTVTIPTYKTGALEKNPLFIEKRAYQGSTGKVYPVPICEKISDTKEDVAYKAVILENDYVRSFMDRTLVVTAPLEVRIRRVMERDGCTREEVEQRLRNQCDDSERIRKADFVIENVEGTDLKAEAEEIISFMKAVKR